MTTSTTPTYPIGFGAYFDAERSITLTADDSLAQFTGPPGIRGSAPEGRGDGDRHVGKSLRFVKVTGPHQCGLATAPEDVIGVMLNKPQVPGDAATVAIRGVVILRAGGEIEAGAKVTANAQGKAVTATEDDRVLGTAITNVKEDDLQVSVLLTLGA